MPKEKRAQKLRQNAFFAHNFSSHRRLSLPIRRWGHLGQAHPAVCPSSPYSAPRRHTAGGEWSSNLGLCCAAAHSMGDGRTDLLPAALCRGADATPAGVCLPPPRCLLRALSRGGFPALPVANFAAVPHRATGRTVVRRRGQHSEGSGEGGREGGRGTTRVPPLLSVSACPLCRGRCEWRAV
jgi:hypothetical protein